MGQMQEQQEKLKVEIAAMRLTEKSADGLIEMVMTGDYRIEQMEIHSTEAVDPEMIAEVLDTMVSLAEDGMTMICVTHEMGFARGVADTMVFMDHGEIVEMAPPEAFFAAPKTERCRDFLQKILHH